MKYQTLFTGENKTNIINLSSAEFIRRVVKVKSVVLLPVIKSFENNPVRILMTNAIIL